MIIVEIKLVSAYGPDHDAELGTLVIDNVTTREKHFLSNGRLGDYRARMYRKGALKKSGTPHKMIKKYKPSREARVEDHQRHTEPVQNLVAKALGTLGYK
jgi:hypothetical protein